MHQLAVSAKSLAGRLVQRLVVVLLGFYSTLWKQPRSLTVARLRCCSCSVSAVKCSELNNLCQSFFKVVGRSYVQCYIKTLWPFTKACEQSHYRGQCAKHWGGGNCPQYCGPLSRSALYNWRSEELGKESSEKKAQKNVCSRDTDDWAEHSPFSHVHCEVASSFCEIGLRKYLDNLPFCLCVSVASAV